MRLTRLLEIVKKDSNMIHSEVLDLIFDEVEDNDSEDLKIYSEMLLDEEANHILQRVLILMIYSEICLLDEGNQKLKVIILILLVIMVDKMPKNQKSRKLNQN